MEPTAPPILPTQIRCSSCGYDLSGTTIGSVCPECGQSVTESLKPGEQLKSSGLAIACMVTGILSPTMCPFIGIVAVILYFLTMNQIKDGGFSKGSRGMAIAGLVTGLVGLGIVVLYVLLFVGMSFSGF